MLSSVTWCKRAARTAILVATMAAGFSSEGGALDLNDIQKRGTLTVATEAAWAPFEFVQDGKIVGYDKDILDLVVKAWGVKLDQQDVPFAGILSGLDQKKFDFICTALFIKPERAEKYAFTLPVAISEVVMTKRKGNDNVKGVDDLSGLVIGAPVPPSGVTAVFKAHNDKLASSGKGAKDIVYFQGSPDTFLALSNGQIDAGLDSNLTFSSMTKNQPDTFEIVGKIGTPFYVAWLTRPEDGALRDALNTEIRKLRDSGVLTELQKKWFGFTMDTPVSGYLPPNAK
jgi:polar amino acid transport system substrate-binding protein